MNTTFNFKRLGLLLQRYFVENKQREFTFWGITIFVFFLMRDSSAAEMFLIISGLIFAAKTFKIFAYTPGGMHYLLIPATHAEKIVSAIILSTIYYFSMFILAYTTGTWLGIELGNLLLGFEKPLTFSFLQMDNISAFHNGQMIQHNGLFKTFISFMITQSMFLLGSLFFKRNAVTKTFLSIIAVSLVLIGIQIVLIKINLGTWNMNLQMNNTLFIPSGMKLFKDYEWVLKSLTYLLIPFLWLVSYFRLTEKQV